MSQQNMDLNERVAIFREKMSANFSPRASIQENQADTIFQINKQKLYITLDDSIAGFLIEHYGPEFHLILLSDLEASATFFRGLGMDYDRLVQWAPTYLSAPMSHKIYAFMKANQKSDIETRQMLINNFGDNIRLASSIDALALGDTKYQDDDAFKTFSTRLYQSFETKKHDTESFKKTLMKTQNKYEDVIRRLT